ncbi:hypothetical protein QFZ77_006351 [Paenibacillus sp. V4I3]|uniref:hypothetical protein n=1 Tax=unclassified Paenibacillus TaxID=185978 RepID=UPI00278991DF|nr:MULTISPECIES: hypothetical protein [unclassified Paenibacillus]MDQ0877692.1 hypothetical protein [Paenibacillus sp. V4I3]MDQ0886433.1 hypothetical protein [Paenibacillus sp. V4I9]
MSDFLAIREIVNEFDPMELIGMGAPDDKHDRLTQKIPFSLKRRAFIFFPIRMRFYPVVKTACD